VKLYATTGVRQRIRSDRETGLIALLVRWTHPALRRISKQTAFYRQKQPNSSNIMSVHYETILSLNHSIIQQEQLPPTVLCSALIWMTKIIQVEKVLQMKKPDTWEAYCGRLQRILRYCLILFCFEFIMSSRRTAQS